MFGKRNALGPVQGAPSGGVSTMPPPAAAPKPAAPPPAASGGEGRAPLPSAGLGAQLLNAPTTPQKTAPLLATDSRRSDSYYEVKGTIFGALIEAIDLAQLARLDADAAREAGHAVAGGPAVGGVEDGDAEQAAGDAAEGAGFGGVGYGFEGAYVNQMGFSSRVFLGFRLFFGLFVCLLLVGLRGFGRLCVVWLLRF